MTGWASPVVFLINISKVLLCPISFSSIIHNIQTQNKFFFNSFCSMEFLNQSVQPYSKTLLKCRLDSLLQLHECNLYKTFIKKKTIFIEDTIFGRVPNSAAN